MKKLLSLATVATLSLGGVVAATPAFAAPGNPTFDTTTLTATEGEAFNYTLIPTFSDAGWGVPDWNNGSRAYLDTETCSSLPAGLSYVQDGVTNGNGVAPTYQISGTPEPGTSGTYNICFLTEDNPDGWFSFGNSQVVSVTVEAASSVSMGASATAIVAGESVIITPNSAPADSWVAWFIDGEYADGAPSSSFPRTIAFEDFNFGQPPATHTVTWVLYETAPFLPVITDPNLASVAVDFVVPVTPEIISTGSVETIVNEYAAAGVGFTATNFVWSGTATVSAIGLPDGLSISVDGYTETGEPVLVITGTATAVGNYSVQVTIADGEQNASFEQAVNVTPAEGEPINGDNGNYNWGTTDFDNMYVFWDSAENGSTEISDADTEYTGDAYDGFGTLYGVNWDESTFRIYATQEPVVTENSISYISENIWSHDAQEYVDVLTTRTFIGNTQTWTVNVVRTGTEIPSSLTMHIEGNLGSDDSTTWASSNDMLTSSDDYSGDPVIIWNTNGNMTYSEGNDDVEISFANATTATLTHVLVGYDSCPTATEVQAHVDTITAMYASNVDTNIPDYTECVPAEITVDNNGTFTQGEENSVDFTLTATGGWDWSYGGSVELFDLPEGLSYTVNNEWTDSTVPSFTVYGTTNYAPGTYTVTANVYDDYSGSATAYFTITVEEATSPTIVATPDTFNGVVGTPVDTTISLNVSGLSFGEGFEGSVEGLPAGLEYEFITAENGDVTGVRIFGTPTETATGGLLITLNDGVNTATNDNVTFAINAAEVVVEATLGLNQPVGSNIADTGAEYSAEGLKEGTEWTLTLRSTPQIIASGTVDNTGLISGLATIPAGLEAGWHSITLDATDVNGNAIKKVVWFELSANGTILAEQTTAPVIPAEPALAETGQNVMNWLYGAVAFLALGIVLAASGARRQGKHVA